MQNGPPAPWGICDADTKREETIEISKHINAYVGPSVSIKGSHQSIANAKPKTKNKNLKAVLLQGAWSTSPSSPPQDACTQYHKKQNAKNVKHKTQKRATVTVRKGKTPYIISFIPCAIAPYFASLIRCLGGFRVVRRLRPVQGGQRGERSSHP